MQDITHSKGKVYYSMGEVAEMFDVNPSLIRYWEKEFDVLKPHRNKKGNRLFTPQDVDNLRIIYHLLKEKKMKIDVARKYLKDNKKEADRDAMIVERLMSIRAMLQQIKQDNLHGAADEDLSELDTEGSSVAATLTASVATAAPAAPDSPVPDIAAQGAIEVEVTLTEVMSEAAEEKKLPFREQMLFEVIVPEAPSLENMIDSFLLKNYDPESADEDSQDLPHDPFAAFVDATGAESGGSGGGEAGTTGAYGTDCAPGPEQEKKSGPTVIEQTLF